MEVNFNNLRKQACKTYDRLVAKMNRDINTDGVLELEVHNIQKEMDELGQLIGSIALCYQPNDPDIKDVFEELYPGDSSMADFNPHGYGN